MMMMMMMMMRQKKILMMMKYKFCKFLVLFRNMLKMAFSYHLPLSFLFAPVFEKNRKIIK